MPSKKISGPDKFFSIPMSDEVVETGELHPLALGIQGCNLALLFKSKKRKKQLTCIQRRVTLLGSTKRGKVGINGGHLGKRGGEEWKTGKRLLDAQKQGHPAVGNQYLN